MNDTSSNRYLDRLHLRGHLTVGFSSMLSATLLAPRRFLGRPCDVA